MGGRDATLAPEQVVGGSCISRLQKTVSSTASRSFSTVNRPCPFHSRRRSVTLSRADTIFSIDRQAVAFVKSASLIDDTGDIPSQVHSTRGSYF